MTADLNIALVFGAGIASVLSPCVLPVVPIVVTGGADDHRLRPLLIVAGLAVTFMAMGVVSSLFGQVLGAKMMIVEKAAGVLVVLFGVMMLFDFNPFKRLKIISGTAVRSRGIVGGFVLGLTLGLIWIPCVGPMLSAVLAIVATRGEVATGVGLLAVYSLGFAVPMLAAGYASQFFRTRIKGAVRFPRIVSIVSGAILIALGITIITKGMVAFGSLIA